MKLTITDKALLLPSLSSHAQPKAAGQKKEKERQLILYGSVYDSFTKMPLKAHLTLMTAGDSAVVDTLSSRAWNNSSFSCFSVPAWQVYYIIKGTREGHEDGYLEMWNNYIPRYMTLSLNYKFTQKPNKE